MFRSNGFTDMAHPDPDAMARVMRESEREAIAHLDDDEHSHDKRCAFCGETVEDCASEGRYPMTF